MVKRNCGTSGLKKARSLLLCQATIQKRCETQPWHEIQKLKVKEKLMDDREFEHGWQSYPTTPSMKSNDAGEIYHWTTIRSWNVSAANKGWYNWFSWFQPYERKWIRPITTQMDSLRCSWNLFETIESHASVAFERSTSLLLMIEQMGHKIYDSTKNPSRSLSRQEWAIRRFCWSTKDSQWFVHLQPHQLCISMLSFVHVKLFSPIVFFSSKIPFL